MAQIKQRDTGWADPGFFAQGSKLRSALRLLWQLFKPPKGHRTLPTKAGWMLILLSLAVGSAAFNTGNNILYLGLALLLGSLLLSGVLSWQNFKGSRWRLQGPERARVGSSYNVGIELANDKSLLPTLALRFVLGEGSIVKTDAVYLSKAIPPGKSTVIYWPWHPQQRGEKFVSLRGIVSEYPFGFLRKTIMDSLKLPIIVWPARAPYELHGSKNPGRTTGNEQRQPGGGAELLKLRAYTPGDPPRSIHWKASARTGNWVVKEFEEPRKPSLDFAADPSTWKADKALTEDCFEGGLCFLVSVLEDAFKRGELRKVYLHQQWHNIHKDPTAWLGLMDNLATLPMTIPLATLPFPTDSAHTFHCSSEGIWRCLAPCGTPWARAL